MVFRADGRPGSVREGKNIFCESYYKSTVNFWWRFLNSEKRTLCLVSLWLPLQDWELIPMNPCLLSLSIYLPWRPRERLSPAGAVGSRRRDIGAEYEHYTCIVGDVVESATEPRTLLPSCPLMKPAEISAAATLVHRRRDGSGWEPRAPNSCLWW